MGFNFDFTNGSLVSCVQVVDKVINFYFIGANAEENINKFMYLLAPLLVIFKQRNGEPYLLETDLSPAEHIRQHHISKFETPLQHSHVYHTDSVTYADLEQWFALVLIAQNGKNHYLGQKDIDAALEAFKKYEAQPKEKTNTTYDFLKQRFVAPSPPKQSTVAPTVTGKPSDEWAKGIFAKAATTSASAKVVVPVKPSTEPQGNFAGFESGFLFKPVAKPVAIPVQESPTMIKLRPLDMQMLTESQQPSMSLFTGLRPLDLQTLENNNPSTAPALYKR